MFTELPTPRGRPSPVPPICELIPQGAWAAAGAADPECGRGCSPRRYKTARRRRICMKLGRGPTQIFLGVEPMKLVCKMQPLVRPATPPSGRMLGPQPEAASAFNLYAEYIMRNPGLEEAQAGIKNAGRNINNLKYADDTTVMAESEEELKSLLMKVKEAS